MPTEVKYLYEPNECQLQQRNNTTNDYILFGNNNNNNNMVLKLKASSC